MAVGIANPFKPTAGARPPLLIGRKDLVDSFSEGLDDGPGAPGRLTIFTGARGVGKTVMLSEVGEEARARGWLALDETATPGLLSRMHEAVRSAQHELDTSSRPRWRVTGVSIAPVGGVTLQPPADASHEGPLRQDLERLLTVLAAHDTGLVITVDEVHRGAIDSLRGLAAMYQHLVRDGREVALVLAGLPSAVSDLLNDDVLTFLRRADQHVLADVDLDLVRRALRDTINESGRTIADEALDAATEATGGYPFMVQLVGYHTWRKAHRGHIDAAAAADGIQAARVRLGNTVHAASLATLSDVDRTFLLAMAQDDGPSRTADVAARLNRKPSYASVYRSRLMAAGIIKRAGHGNVDFAVPYLREYLRDHAATYAMDEQER